MSTEISSDEDFINFDTLCYTTNDDQILSVIDRLNEIHISEQKRIFFVSLHGLAASLGANKWEIKKNVVGEHIMQSFANKFSEPDWCVQLDEKAYLMVLPTIQAHSGALSCAQIWYETSQFFIGTAHSDHLPLFEVKVGDVNLLLLQRIEVDKYYDPSSTMEQQTKTPKSSGQQADTIAKTETSANFEEINLKTIANPSEFLRNLGFGVMCALEPIFDLRQMRLVGYNLEITVNTRETGRDVDITQLRNMPWQHRQVIDFTGICMGFKILDNLSSDKRKPILFLPVSFSTLDSAQARSGILSFVAKKAEKLGVKIVYEIKDVKNVPLYKLIEMSSIIKPHCVAVIGHLGSFSKDVFDIKQYRLSGVAFHYDEQTRNETELFDWFSKLSRTVKGASGSCIVQGLSDLKQVAIAQKAGVTHATLKSKSLMAI